MVTEARKRANAKWDKENMVVLACKVKRETAEQFKAACAAQGTTSNAVLQQAVKAYLQQAPAQEPPRAPGIRCRTMKQRPGGRLFWQKSRSCKRLGRMLNDARPRQTGWRTVPARY